MLRLSKKPAAIPPPRKVNVFVMLNVISAFCIPVTCLLLCFADSSRREIQVDRYIYITCFFYCMESGMWRRKACLSFHTNELSVTICIPLPLGLKCVFFFMLLQCRQSYLTRDPEAHPPMIIHHNLSRFVDGGCMEIWRYIFGFPWRGLMLPAEDMSAINSSTRTCRLSWRSTLLHKGCFAGNLGP